MVNLASSCSSNIFMSRYRVVLADEISYATDTWSHKRKSLAFCYSLYFYVSHTHPTRRTGNSIFTSEKLQLHAGRMWFEDVALEKEVHGIGTKTPKDNWTTVLWFERVCPGAGQSAFREGESSLPGHMVPIAQAHLFLTEKGTSISLLFWRTYLITQRVATVLKGGNYSRDFPMVSLANVYFKGSTIWLWSLWEVPTFFHIR